MFVVKPLLTELLHSPWPNHPLQRRRNAITSSEVAILQTEANLQTRSEHAEALRNAVIPPDVRHVSGRSEQPAATAGTEYSLWRDPDLEDKLQSLI